MSKLEEKAKQWWIFYPLKGLDINDEEHDLLKPMFGDCTILSRKHIGQIVHLLRLNERDASGYDHEHDVIYILENATFNADFQSLVAVRRSGIITNEPSRMLPPFLLSAKLRAYGISALLSIVLLSRSQSGATIGLVEQLHSQISSIGMLELQSGGFQYQTVGCQSLTLRSPKDIIRLSRQQIQEVLKEEPYVHLTNALLPQNPTLPKSIYRALMQSTIRLSDAMHSVTESSRLLGAVTSMEILLAEQGDSYQTLNYRLIALLGLDTIETFDTGTILQARHLYVHQGYEPEDSWISLNAIGLALSCLLRFAEAASSFTAKSHILDYLDLIGAVDKMADYNDSEDKNDNFHKEILLKHNRSGYELPFLSMILDQRDSCNSIK